MTVHLVRHGKAGRRDESDPHDFDRHLSPKGRAQADHVAVVLGNEAIVRIASSSANRCVETVQPLADKLGLAVVVHPNLVEGTPVDQSWAFLEATIASLGDGESAVLCSHGDVIPDLVRRAQVRGARVDGAVGWSKGSVWSLHHSDGDITEAVFRPALDI